MVIVEKSVKDLIPYANNPRKNNASVDAVAASIREFGFKVPIVIDKDNIIVAGHTRLKAAKKLHLKTVPCVIADDLTDEQIQAFRLADNKVGEASEWDFDLLNIEIESLPDFDFTEFGFEPINKDADDVSDDDDGYYGDERERTYNAVNLNEYDETRTAGYYQMPTLEVCNAIPTKLVGFNYILSTNDRDCGVHFFIDDYQFERIWNEPHKIMPRLEGFECALTPDFSLYMNMPRAMKVWNTYRSRLIGQIMQDYGYEVVPTISWAEKETFDFCFDGLPQNGTIAVSTVGVMRDIEAKEIWRAGMDEAIKRLSPKTILCYGSKIDYDFHGADVIWYDARGFAKEE